MADLERDDLRGSRDPVAQDSGDTGVFKVFGWLIPYIAFGLLYSAAVIATPERMRPWTVAVGAVLFIGVGLAFTFREWSRRNNTRVR